ncbi:putative glycosyl hydrolase [Podospora conica]|nr:putative glycosyl hydrolase [Schizothecium conicum]
MVGKTTAIALLGLTGSALAQSTFKVDSPDSIAESAKTLASDLIALYHGDEPGRTVGLLDGPPTEGGGDYYWWQSGMYWATLLEYRRVTGDQQYDKLAIDALVAQSGIEFGPKNAAYMPVNQTATLGNDEQCMWGLAALHAAETDLPAHDKDDVPTWLGLAENVLKSQLMRWDNEIEDEKKAKEPTCGGGLRWQIPPSNAGYNYKNSWSNGCYFDLAARLGALTGNQTYTDAATTAFEWMQSVGLIDKETWRVYDGGHTEQNCSDINKIEFSANAAVLISGAAHMYNSTGSATWKNRLDGLLAHTLKNFFPDGVAVERACETGPTCTTDMFAFKGILHRELSLVPALAPYTRDALAPVLRSSAEAAVKQCTGGDSKRQCGFYWSDGEFVKPDTTGVGETMSVLSAVQGLLALEMEGKAAVGGGGNGNGSAAGGSGAAGGGAGGAAGKTGDPNGAAQKGVKGMVWMVMAGAVGAMVM